MVVRHHRHRCRRRRVYREGIRCIVRWRCIIRTTSSSSRVRTVIISNIHLHTRLRHINTFGGHPGACAVAVGNLQIFEEENLVERSAAMGERLGELLAGLEENPHVGQVRGRGLLYGIEVVENRETRKPAGAERMGSIISGCKERGLIVGKNGDTTPGFNNVVTICPPLNLTDDDLSFMAETLGDVFGGDGGGRKVRPPIA